MSTMPWGGETNGSQPTGFVPGLPTSTGLGHETYIHVEGLTELVITSGGRPMAADYREPPRSILFFPGVDPVVVHISDGVLVSANGYAVPANQSLRVNGDAQVVVNTTDEVYINSIGRVFFKCNGLHGSPTRVFVRSPLIMDS